MHKTRFLWNENTERAFIDISGESQFPDGSPASIRELVYPAVNLTEDQCRHLNLTIEAMEKRHERAVIAAKWEGKTLVVTPENFEKGFELLGFDREGSYKNPKQYKVLGRTDDGNILVIDPKAAPEAYGFATSHA